MHTYIARYGVITALVAVTLLFAGFIVFTDPIAQDANYHNLANGRDWISVPNFQDVFSNIAFAAVGLAGIALYRGKTAKISIAWLFFFIGLLLVAPGSSYYHLSPNNQTLVWDRLPMTVSFMSLFVALLAENVSDRYEKPLLPVAIALGLSSVFYWHYSNDLRFYGFVQFGTLISIPVILFFYKSRYTHRHYLLYGLLFYILAKIFELNDKLVFKLTGHAVSGHTIKHLLAAGAAYCVYLMLKTRQRIA